MLKTCRERLYKLQGKSETPVVKTMFKDRLAILFFME
jgi:hypothetical protein